MEELTFSAGGAATCLIQPLLDNQVGKSNRTDKGESKWFCKTLKLDRYNDFWSISSQLAVRTQSSWLWTAHCSSLRYKTIPTVQKIQCIPSNSAIRTIFLPKLWLAKKLGEFWSVPSSCKVGVDCEDKVDQILRIAWAHLFSQAFLAEKIRRLIKYALKWPTHEERFAFVCEWTWGG